MRARLLGALGSARTSLALGLALAPLLLGCGPRVFEGESAKIVEAPVPTREQLEAAAPRVELSDDRIIIHEKIQFDYNAATIKAESDDLLAELAGLIRDNPRVTRIRVEGHASAEGDYEHNLELSRRRAEAVVAHLVERGGVGSERLESVGYGPDQPIADNESEEGREANRRVEFHILAQEYTETKTVTDPQTGDRRVTTRKKRARSEDEAESEGGQP